ncbi:MAG: RNA polymerase factor sigma-54 [Prevotella sp.]|nr:RNA polymerase factor sigma-54 [Prevotella sp.]MBR5060808.1 RNA polymerase factor sigma-54 [Prevotella sp.]
MKNSQTLEQTAKQELKQRQRLSQQQMLQVRLIGMSVAELEEKVKAEIYDNPALETAAPTEDGEGELESTINGLDGGDMRDTDGDDRDEGYEQALEEIGLEEEMSGGSRSGRVLDEDYVEPVYGNVTSFHDSLKEQMGEENLTDTQRYALEYLIGSLDNDGYLRKNLEDISDELAIYHNIDMSVNELETVLHVLQSFDPPGIGARSLQECLLIQIDRKSEELNNENDFSRSSLYSLSRLVVTKYFDEFLKKHWEKIRVSLGVSESKMEDLQREIRRLNPKPGSAMGESVGRSLQQITPDFLVHTSEDGSITFSLNDVDVPDLKVSPDYLNVMGEYKNDKSKLTRAEKESLAFYEDKVSKAQGFIDAIKQRRLTLQKTMKAIIEWQRKYFQEGDEADLKPMILKDISEKTGLDISTISRVSNEKYVQTNWGTFPLRHFFSDGYVTEDGEETSTRKIKLLLKELIDKETKNKPLSDDALAAAMKDLGYPIARRTVAKYREQMGIPVARLRKE